MGPAYEDQSCLACLCAVSVSREVKVQKPLEENRFDSGLSADPEELFNKAAMET